MRVRLLVLNIAVLNIAVLGAVASSLGGCGAAGQVRRGLGDAAAQPLVDLNVRRELIPTVLLQAQANPYDQRNLNQCAPIAAEVTRLNAALGPDRDEPPAPDGSTLNERGQDALAQGALSAIRGAMTDFIPYRNWVRILTGAQARSKTVQDAVEAGRLRRAFLKGQGMRLNCAPPASPAWFRPTNGRRR